MALSDHFETAYPKLHALAERLFRRQPSTSTLQATALVHEVYLRFARLDPDGIKDREHFMAMAATAMHQILTDRARRRNASKRGGGGGQISLAFPRVLGPGTVCDVLLIHDLITRLSELDPRQARVVEMRIFADMTVPEVAKVLSVSVATVEMDWRKARAWMRAELDGVRDR
jgi:RNA polymerase sigma-70 factor (ECF subfamily)